MTRESSDKSGLIRFHSFIYNVEILRVTLCYQIFGSPRVSRRFLSTFRSVQIKPIATENLSTPTRKRNITTKRRESSVPQANDDFPQVSVLRVTRNEKFRPPAGEQPKQWIYKHAVVKCEIKDTR